jgi:hypothetical protein
MELAGGSEQPYRTVALFDTAVIYTLTPKIRNSNIDLDSKVHINSN